MRTQSIICDIPYLQQKSSSRREGVVLTAPFSVEDAELIKMYAAYLYRKRATPEPMHILFAGR